MVHHSRTKKNDEKTVSDAPDKKPASLNVSDDKLNPRHNISIKDVAKPVSEHLPDAENSVYSDNEPSDTKEADKPSEKKPDILSEMHSDNADTASIYGHFIQPIHINNDIIVAYTDETNDFWLSVVDYACKLGYYNRVFSSHNLNLLYLIAKFGLNLDIHSCDNINSVFNGISVSKFTDAVTNLDNFIFSKTVPELISIFEECKRNDVYIFDIHLIIALINKNMTFMSYFKSNTPYNLRIRNCKGSDLSSIQWSNNEIWFEGSALINNVNYSDDWS